MSRLAIEINDAGLVAVDEQRIIRTEPGFAVVDRKRIITGDEAFALSRLRPRDTSASHWSDLSIEPGSARVPGRRSTAELAHAQLEALWADVGHGIDEVVLVVPGTFTGDQLGILLGLAEECGIPAGAIVDAAVAASLRPWPGRQLVHVDAGLLGAYVTPLEQLDSEVRAAAPIRLDSMGLGGLADSFARRIAELFVLGTRFDPFHEASTEQRLYNGLAAVLDAVDREGSARFAIDVDDEAIEIEIERSQLLGGAQGFYRALRQLIAQTRQAQTPLVVLLAHRLAGLPGLEDELARLDVTTVLELEPGFAARAALAAADSLGLDRNNVRLYRRLAWREAPAEESAPAAQERAGPGAAAAEGPPATHVVYKGVAYAVNGEGLVIGRSRLDRRKAIVIESRAEGVSRAHCELAIVDGELRLRDLSSFGTFVNDRRIDGEEVLRPADVIRVGSPGAELTVVRLENTDGA